MMSTVMEEATANVNSGAGRGHEPPLSGASKRLAVLAVLALWIMMPVTLPVPVLRELVQDRFAVSEFLTSLFMSINMIGAFVTAPVAGAVADRWGGRRALLAGALAFDALCFFVLSLRLPFEAFLAIRFVEGCAHITALSVLLSLASRVLPEQQRGRAMGIVGGSMMLGVALGAPIGGVLGRTSAILPLEVGAALALAGAALAAISVRDVDGSAAESRPSFAQIGATLRSQPALLVPLAFAFADRFTVGFFTTTFSLYLGRIHGLSSVQIGASIAVFMLPFALFSYPFGRLAERASTSSLLCGGSLAYGIGTMAVGFAGPPELYGLMFAIGIAAAVMFVPSMIMTTQLASADVRATALGAFNAAGSLGFIAGPLVGGAISEWVAASSGWLIGYRAAFVTAGVSELICVAIALPFLLRLRAQGRAT
jgi:MFS family permease